MLTNLIENRGKEFSNLLKIGDYLARSLRENVELFFVDNGKVSYITESKKVIVGNYSFKPTLKLTNIQVDDSAILEDQNAFDAITDKKVSIFLEKILNDDYQEASESFDGILNLWETKLSYDRIKDRLNEKTARFGEQSKIVSSPEFEKVWEIKDHIIDFLKENSDIVNIPEIKNGIKLATVVANSFNLPKVEIDDLKESKVFQVNTLNNKSIYEHLCRQELIAKELLEAKENFDTVWADNENISNLASMVNSLDKNKIMESVAIVVSETPYFALATKKQINNIISNCLALNENHIPSKDITKFVHNIYEMKKPIKQHLLKILNTKYGININNLTDIPTFSNLIKTENVILTSIAKLAPKNSVVRQVLIEFCDKLKLKNGSESIDLMEFINYIFSEAGFDEAINETSLMSYMDFNKVADDLGKIGSVLKMIQPMLQGAGGGMPNQEPDGDEMPMEDPMGMEGEEEGSEGIEGMEGEEGMDSDVSNDDAGDPIGNPAEDPEEAALGAEEEGMEGMEGGEDEEMLPPAPGEEELGMEGEEGESVESAEKLNDLMSDLEELISSIKTEIGSEDPTEEDAIEVDSEGEGEIPEEEEAEGQMPEEGGEDEVEFDDSEDDDSEEEEK